LEGAMAGKADFDRKEIDQLLAGLGKRIFLLYDVHEEGLSLFQTRWTLSYLRGPMTRDELKRFNPAGTETAKAPDSPAPASVTRSRGNNAAGSNKPLLPAEVPEYFAPADRSQNVLYQPFLIGVLQLRYSSAKHGINMERTVARLVPFSDGPISVHWDQAEPTDLSVETLLENPAEESQFLPLPAAAMNPKSYPLWSRDFAAATTSAESLVLFRSDRLEMLSEPGETEGAFRVRMQQRFREVRDQLIADLKENYAARFRALEERRRKAEQRKQIEQDQARSATLTTVVNVGSSILGALFGRKALSATNINRAGSAVRGVTRTIEQSRDVNRANETVEAVREHLSELEKELETEVQSTLSSKDPGTEKFEQILIPPARTQSRVKLLALVWVPVG
jgi:hypothetical protein